MYTDSVFHNLIYLRSKERRSASMSNIDTNEFNVNLEKELRKLNNKLPPPNVVGSTDIFIRDLNASVKIYQNSSGRIFYHNSKLGRSSWKPPRNLKPNLQTNLSDSIIKDSLSLRDSEEDNVNVSVPRGYIEHFDQNTGITKHRIS